MNRSRITILFILIAMVSAACLIPQEMAAYILPPTASTTPTQSLTPPPSLTPFLPLTMTPPQCLPLIHRGNISKRHANANHLPHRINHPHRKSNIHPHPSRHHAISNSKQDRYPLQVLHTNEKIGHSLPNLHQNPSRSYFYPHFHPNARSYINSHPFAHPRPHPDRFPDLQQRPDHPIRAGERNAAHQRNEPAAGGERLSRAAGQCHP